MHLMAHPKPAKQDDRSCSDHRPGAEANVAPDLSRVFILRDLAIALL